jgi:hypothetical protein
MRNLFVIIATIFLVVGCKKDAENGNCVLLKEGMKNNNIEQVKQVITRFISTLPTNDYTEANINKLVSIISGNCNLTSGLYCFDCIQTLPSQTEIWIELANNGTTLRKTIDITYTSGDNKIKFGNMHD